MCRLILAIGKFKSKDIAVAATEMCLGLHTNVRAPIHRHPHGWGAIWLDSASPPQLKLHRSGADLASDSGRSMIEQLDTHFLAMHARFASVSENAGVAYAHPITRPGPVTWHIMHNGFLPTVHEQLGHPCSTFDSLEYLEYATRCTSAHLCRPNLVRKLERLRAGGTAGNAFFINNSRAYAFQWFPKESENASFYTMYVHATSSRTIVSSEPISALGAVSTWRPLQSGDLLRFEFI
jgi:predicted glutamine amidotransferase